MATANAVIAIAVREIGPQELDGKDSTKYGRWYGFNPAFWCAMFIAWCGDQAAQEDGSTNPYATDQYPKGFASTEEWVRALQANSAWHQGSHSGMRAGDVVFYRGSRAAPGRFVTHVELCIAAPGADGSYTTVGGNTDDSAAGFTDSSRVAMHVKRLESDGSFVGYGRILYDGDPNAGLTTRYDPASPLIPTYRPPPKRPLYPIKNLPLLTNDGALAAIRVSGNRLPTEITGRTTAAQLTFASTEKSRLELGFQDDADATITCSGLFARDPEAQEFGRAISLDFGDQHMQVTTVRTSPGRGGPALAITALSASVRELTGWQHIGQVSFGQVTGAKWVAEIAASVGARSKVQPLEGDFVLARQAGQTTWEVMQQLAKAQGAVCYEHDNTIFYGKPSWLAAQSERLWSIRWSSHFNYSPEITGLPDFEIATDDSNADVLEFGLISADRMAIRPGHLVQYTTPIPQLKGLWLVDQAVMPLMRSQVVKVRCGRIVDPVPEPPTGTLNDIPSIGAGTGGYELGTQIGGTP